MKLEEIKTTEPFKSLFPIERQVLDRVREDMQTHGYDPSQPIVLWIEEGVVIDGHTRLEAAKNLGLEEVPVHEKSFADEDEALAYAIHGQRDRRNLTSADIIRLVDTLDARLKRGERTDLASGDAKSPEASKRKSAAKTAATIGVSQATVERTRTILDHAPDQIKEEVKKGKKSIKAAYEETQARRKIKRDTKLLPTAQKTVDAPEGASDKKGLQEIKPPAPLHDQKTNGSRKPKLYFFEAEQFTEIAISQLSRVVMDERAIPFLMRVRNYIDEFIRKIKHGKRESRINSEAEYFVTAAISLLRKIHYNDPGYIEGLREVKDYIDKQLEVLTGVLAYRQSLETKVSPVAGNDDSENNCPVPVSVDGPNSPFSVRAVPLAAGDSETSGKVGAHQKVCCHDCRKLMPSPNEPDKGVCERYPKPFQVGKEVVCSDFESKDSSGINALPL